MARLVLNSAFVEKIFAFELIHRNILELFEQACLKVIFYAENSLLEFLLRFWCACEVSFINL